MPQKDRTSQWFKGSLTLGAIKFARVAWVTSHWPIYCHCVDWPMFVTSV